LYGSKEKDEMEVSDMFICRKIDKCLLLSMSNFEEIMKYFKHEDLKKSVNLKKRALNELNSFSYPLFLSLGFKGFKGGRPLVLRKPGTQKKTESSIFSFRSTSEGMSFCTKDFLIYSDGSIFPQFPNKADLHRSDDDSELEVKIITEGVYLTKKDELDENRRLQKISQLEIAKKKQTASRPSERREDISVEKKITFLSPGDNRVIEKKVYSSYGNVPTFFRDCCIVETEYPILFRLVYDRYCDWCAEKGEKKTEKPTGRFAKYFKMLDLSVRNRNESLLKIRLIN
jgi:hypothetical protein